MSEAHDKSQVALSSVVASGGMALAKFAVGLLTGSIGILSEAAHSLLDLGAALLTYFAVRVGDLPADEDHPYGHAKVESVSALIETGLLFVTSAWIVYEAIVRLRSDVSHVETTWYAVAVIAGSIVIDFFRARALSRVAKATGSQALEADALHFSSDILSSSVVLLGLGGVWLGYPKADAVAALAVAIFVCRAGYALGKRTIDILIDTAPEGAVERIAELTLQVQGVAKVDRVRVRPAGKTVFVEVQARVGRTLSMERVREISSAITARIRRELPDADVVVQTQPLALDSETIADQVRLIAANRGLSVHRIAVQRVEARIYVSFDLEVAADLSIKQAHDIASDLEAAIEGELGQELVVESRIDPQQPEIVEEATALTVSPHVRTVIAEEQQHVAGLVDVHNLNVRRVPGGLHVSFHCRFEDRTALGAVDAAVRRLEHRLYERLPAASRIVIHAEPIWHLDRDDGRYAAAD
ncbi:MAG: cation diffusion facilitator family transporter [Gammaproteobacteria bacterium]|nr:cation diffusion facilitator family transporter [Gammaproteobacteria bacterium]